jgi:molybdate transport system ATP-binding protein
MSLDLEIEFARDGFRLEVGCAVGARVTALYGRSGAGKSTLLHLLAGLLRPDRGRISLDGAPLVDRARGIWVPPHRRGIAVVFQDGRLLPHYSVRGNLLYGRRRARGRAGEPALEPVVELLELGPLLDRRPSRLSGGEAQRVAVGRALLSGPRLLLLDEPLTGLDEGLKRQVLPFLQRVRDELDLPILYVSHHLEELLQVTDRMIVLDGGRLVGQGRYVDLAMTGRVGGATPGRGLTNVLRLSPDASGRPSIDTPAGAGQALRLPGTGPPAACAVAIRPEDIALATATVPATSIRNQLRARVVRCSHHADAVLVEVDVGQPLVVQITDEAARELAVSVGAELVCLVKSTAIRPLGSLGSRESSASSSGGRARGTSAALGSPAPEPDPRRPVQRDE